MAVAWVGGQAPHFLSNDESYENVAYCALNFIHDNRFAKLSKWAQFRHEIYELNMKYAMLCLCSPAKSDCIWCTATCGHASYFSVKTFSIQFPLSMKRSRFYQIRLNSAWHSVVIWDFVLSAPLIWNIFNKRINYCFKNWWVCFISAV